MRMKRWLLGLLAVVAGWWLWSSVPVQAAQNAWVDDQAGVLSAATKAKVASINETTFAQVTGHPQLAVMTVDHIPAKYDDIDDYGVAMFEHYQPGRRDWDNGLLLTVAVADRRYRLTVGYGLEAAIPDGSKQAIVNAAVTKNLRAGDYDQAIRQMVQRLSQRVVKNEAQIRTPQDLQEKQRRDRRIKIGVVIGGIILALLLGVGLFAFFHQRKRWREYAERTLQDDAFLRRYPLVRFVPWPQQRMLVRTGVAPSQLTEEQVVKSAALPYLREHLDTILSQNPVALEYPASEYSLVSGQLSDRALLATKTLPALVAQLNPKLRQIKPTMLCYQQAFYQYATRAKLTPRRQAQLLAVFGSHVDYLEAVTSEEAVTLFATLDKYLDKNGQLKADAKNADILLLPAWWGSYRTVTLQSQSSSSNSGSFGSDFGGGSTGGGGFSGGW